MEPEIYKYRLKKNYQTIVKDLEAKKLVGFLYQDDIFDEDDMEEVRSERTRKRQAEQLLNLLSTKPVQGYSVLVKALEETQPHLAKVMNTPALDENRIAQSGSRQLEQHRQDLDDLENISQMLRFMTGNERDPVELSEPYRMTEGGLHLYQTTDAGSTVKPTHVRLIQSSYWPGRPESRDFVYKMTSSPRGLAVIINIMDFVPDPSQHCKHDEKLEKRVGSDVDVFALIKLFQDLNFRVISLENKKKDELLKELQDISKNCQLLQHDCFAMCIMSHGKDDFFYCYDGGKIKISEIKRMFNNVNCPTLCQKPKLFFIQACRGQSKDFGRTVSDAPSEHSEIENEKEHADKGGYHFKEKALNTRTISENADILLAYSCVEGYTSYRNTELGSRFITCLVNIFQQFAGYEDVLSMMTMVINNVNKEGILGDKQVPKPETTLTKKVFFWPGIRDFTSNNY